jgi:hypothetical protein
MKTSKKDPDAKYRRMLEPLAEQFVRATPEQRRYAVAGMLPHSAPSPCACWPNFWSRGWTTRMARYEKVARTPWSYSARTSCRPSVTPTSRSRPSGASRISRRLLRKSVWTCRRRSGWNSWR